MKILVVGVGSMGWNHARVCHELGVLSGVCDSNKEQVDVVSGNFRVPGYANLDDALNEIKPDGVIISTPTSSHYPLVKKSLEHGTNVLVEKPITSDIAQGEELVSLAGKCDLTLSVGHIERHNPVIERAKVCLDSGDWGELITLNARRVSPFSGRINDVGAILDTGIHDIDNLLYLVDSKPVNVFATGGSFNQIDLEDHANIIINFENGKSGVIEVNWITPMKVRTLSLTCEKAFVELDYIKQQLFISKSSVSESDSPRLYPPPIEFKSTKISLNNQEPLKLEIEDFINSISNGTKPLVAGESALLALKVGMAAVKSLQYGEVIPIE
tara:strand:+ start:2502 stop:3482 length:981 start_codon:yes stop_codon:yes gene_type:complete